MNEPTTNHLWERISAKKYYGSHSMGMVLLRNGYPVIHVTASEVSAFIKEYSIIL